MTDARLPRLAVGRWSLIGLLAVAWVYLGAISIGYYVVGTAGRHQVESAWFILAGLATLVTLASGSASNTVPADRARFSPRAVLVGIAGSAVLYSRSLGVGLLSDDYALLEMAPGFGGGWEYFRPLPLTVWWVVHPLLGAAGLHAINIALHGVNAALVYRLALSLSPRSAPSFAISAAAVFLTFPAAVEAVTWSAGIFDVILVTWSLMFLTSLLDDTPRARTITLMSFAAALLSKETAVALPLLGWALAFRGRVDRRALAGATAVAGVYALVRLQQAELPALDGPLTFIAKEFLSRPFATLGVPWTSAEVASAAVLVGILIPLLVAGLLVGYALQPTIGIRPIVSAVWVVAGVTPLMGTLFVTADLEGTRYLYLPLVGWAVLLSELAAHQALGRARQLALAALAGIVSVGAYGSWRHQTAWLEAAAFRDVVLREARAAMASGSCESGVFGAVPESLHGAFVFRNGFVEAARQAGFKAELSSSSPEDGRSCRFEWTDAGFRHVPSGD